MFAQDPECPNCGTSIRLLEPTDLDGLGLTQNVRSNAVKSGDLNPSTRLRGGKFFLYLRQDVDAYLAVEKNRKVVRAAKRVGLDPNNEEVVEYLRRAFESDRENKQRGTEPQ